MSTPLAYRLRIRTTADDADDLVISSIPTDDYPYIAADGIPKGDGSTLDPLTGQVTIGAYTVQVIDAIGTVPAIDTTATLTDTFQYANQAAAESAGWVFTDTLSDGVTTVGATDQFYTGTKSIRMATTGTGQITGANEYLRAVKTFDAGGGIAPSTVYRVTAHARNDTAYQLDIATKLFVSGAAGDTAVTTSDTWQALTLLATSSAGAELTVTLHRAHPYVRTTQTAWWGGLTIEALDPAGSTTGRIVTSRLTDSEGQQHLLSRKAYLEESTTAGMSWTVLTAGYVNRYALVDALRWEFSIGESRRIEQSTYLFERTSNPVDFPELIGTGDATHAGMDRACCLVGHPMVGDFGPYRDMGRPLYEVGSVTGATVHMRWISGYLSSPYRESGPPIADNPRTFFNAAALDYLPSETTFLGGGGNQFAPLSGLVVRVYDAGTGAWIADHQALANARGGPKGFGFKFLDTGGQFYAAWVGTPPSVGQRYKVSVFPSLISERNPLHVSGHPMDILAAWLTIVGQDYDETSRLAVRSALGDDLILDLRPTARMIAKDACENYIYAPFGVAPRLTDAGTLEFFLTRDPGAASVDTLTIDDLSSDAGTAFSNEEAKAANKVTLKCQGLLPTDEKTDSVAFDAIRTSSITVTVDAQDTSGNAIFGDREIQWDIPGAIRGLATGTTEEPGNLDLWVAAQARPLFDWQGRGSVEGEFHVLRDRTTAKLGQILSHAFVHVPTASPLQAPTSQRGTVLRRAIILRRTVVPEGLSLLLQDRGPSDAVASPPPFVQPLPCVAIDPVTDLAATVVGLTVTLTWTSGADDVPIEVSYREAADTDPIAVLTLPEGSITATLNLPDAATTYTFTVQYREPAPRDCTSDAVEVDATTDAIATLPAPTDPAAFADGAGTFGMSVTPAAVDAAVEVWVAVETAIGSATAGAYTVDGSTASVTPRTSYTVEAIAPNDGLLRYLKARHTKTGYTASAYTDPVSINPWTLVPNTDPTPPPPTPAAITAAPFEISAFRPGVWMYSYFPSAREPFVDNSHPDDIYDLSGVVSGRVVATVPLTLAAVGSRAGWEYSLDDGDTWDPLSDQDEGPWVAVDTASMAEKNGAKDGDWFLIAPAARTNVRLRPVMYGGDDTGRFIPSGVVLQGRSQADDLPPEDLPEAPEEHPCVSGAGDCGAALNPYRDLLNYPTLAAYAAAGWTVVNPGGIASVGVSNSDTEANDFVLTASITGTGVGSAYIEHTFLLEPLTAYTFKVRGKFTAEFLADTGNLIRVVGGGDVSFSTDTWSEGSVPGTTDAGGHITIQIGRFNGMFVDVGTHVARFRDFRICGGTSPCVGGPGDGGETNTNTGGGEDGTDPVPPPTPANGDRPFICFNIPTTGAGLWDCTVRSPSTPANCVSLLNSADTAGLKVIINLAGTKSNWINPDGTFSKPRYKAQLDAIKANAAADAAVTAGIASGLIFAEHVFDEPFAANVYGGQRISAADVEWACAYTKTLWPGIVTLCAMPATAYPADIPSLDVYWFQYTLNFGDCATYCATQYARVLAYGKQTIAGINVIHFTVANNSGAAITADQLRHYGGIIAKSSVAVGYGMWRFEAAWYARPGIPSAVADVQAIWQSYD